MPLITPTSSPIIPTPRKQEVVLFVGYPCLGKTSFFKRYFQSEDYLHINQDTLKSRDKCVRAVKNALESGHSCVIGLFHSILFFVFLTKVLQIIRTVMLLLANTTSTFATPTRFHLGMSYVHETLTPITFFWFRCFVFTGSMELAWHNNLYRAFNLPLSIVANEVSDAGWVSKSCFISFELA